MSTYQASSFVKISAVASQIALSSSVALITHASKSDGEYHYNTLTVQMFSELIKLCVSAMLLAFHFFVDKDPPQVTLDVWQYGRACVPGLLYFVSNNLNFFILREIDPMAFQILNNLKILSTALMFRFFMGAEVTGLQWRMLMLLMLGSVISQLGGCDSGESSGGGGGLRGSVMGYSLLIFNVFVTAFATVYNEKFMKSNNDSIHFQNFQLYSFGLIFGVTACARQFQLEFFSLSALTEGYNWTVVALIFNYAFVGIATSAVLKYLDNMTKTFSANAAMFVVAIISIVVYKEDPTTQLFIGMAVAAISIETYNSQASTPVIKGVTSLPVTPEKLPLLKTTKPDQTHNC